MPKADEKEAPLHAKCRHCERDIVRYDTHSPWRHLLGGGFRCTAATSAEPVGASGSTEGPCRSCHGLGTREVPGGRLGTCPACNGTGASGREEP